MQFLVAEAMNERITLVDQLRSPRLMYFLFCDVHYIQIDMIQMENTVIISWEIFLETFKELRIPHSSQCH